jgi:choline-sulfatase
MSKTPNVVVFLADQFRYDAVGCNGGQICRTPAIDALADQGMRFGRAYTPLALCSPARASILTGLYPHNHGLLANMRNFNGVFDNALLRHTGYPELLKDAGYQTAYVGKWHMPEEGNKSRWGFSDWYTDRDWIESLATEGVVFDRGKNEVQRMEWGEQAKFCGRSTLPAEQMQESWCSDRTIKLIEEYSSRTQPFAIVTGYYGPHFPYSVPAPYDTMYSPDDVPELLNFQDDSSTKPTVQQKERLRWNSGHLSWSDWQNVIAHYWGYCTFIDNQISRVIESLKNQNVYDDTVIIFTSDHGDMLGSHRLFNKGYNMYEETHRVPLIIRWPEKISSAKLCTDFVSTTDLMPTLLEVAGIEKPSNIDGRSIVPLLEGYSDNRRDSVFAEFHGYETALCTIRMVRTDRWKYIYNPCSEDELYDVDSDPGELCNLVSDLGHKHILRRMKGRLVQWLRDTHDTIAVEDNWKSCSYDLFISKREK